MASRLPRPGYRGSSPDASTALGMSTLKRKASPDEDDELQDRPQKLPAIASRTGSNRPLQPNRTAGNISSSRSKPTPPVLGTAVKPKTRGTSAPPSQPTVRPPAKSSLNASRTGMSTGRSVSGSAKPTSGKTTDLASMHTRLTTLEAGREADAARVAAQLQAERDTIRELQDNQHAMARELSDSKKEEMEQTTRLRDVSDELSQLKQAHARQIMELELSVMQKDSLHRQVSERLRVTEEDLERERQVTSTLKATISQQSSASITAMAEKQALQAQLDVMQTQLSSVTRTRDDLSKNLEEALAREAQIKEDLIAGETVRRKLHNMVQELKGNIRVFCRVRPILPSDLPSSGAIKELSEAEFEKAKRDMEANYAYPDRRNHKEIVFSATTESATGQTRPDNYSFGFDRVFEPQASQAEVFEEVSLLAQSVTDGYNVCIFAYGQTGSGKSFTMEGVPTPELSGMIPRAVDQVFRVADDLKSKGWVYKMEGQFLEIYNETINDLLGKGEFDKKKHEIKHDLKTGTTRVTDMTVIPLQSAGQVRQLLVAAQSRRSVAATLMNERSSRSHSVFTLRITGVNESSGESCEGCLNLVDLAGSERINVSFGEKFGTGANGAGSDKERLRETQNINRSLSALGDVIAALGEKSERGDKHIPYRNSKLTYLLQNSLSGNSKTLMILNLSPLAVHLQESLTSLRFATKVNNTNIGTAKKQLRTS